MAQKTSMVIFKCIFIWSTFLIFGCKKAVVEHETKQDILWKEPPVSVGIPFGNSLKHVEFSSDNRMVCVFSEDGQRIVFDLEGNRIEDALGDSDTIIKRNINLFDRAIPFSWTDGDQYNCLSLDMFTNPYIADLITSASSWRVDKEINIMARLLNTNKGYPNINILELWSLNPIINKIWSLELETESRRWLYANFLKIGNEKRFFVADNERIFVFGCDSNRILEKIDYSENGDFFGISADFEPYRTLFAVGFRRFIKVYRINQKTVLQSEFVLPGSSQAKNSMLGYDRWEISRIQFTGKSYLSVFYAHESGGRMAGGVKIESYIALYNVVLGKIIWQSGQDEIQDLAISPDENKLAILRNGILKIGDFP